MATIRKRNGKFQAQVRIAGRPSITKTFATKANARAWVRCAEALTERPVRLPEEPKADVPTFGQLIERYYQQVLSQRQWSVRELSIVKHYRKSKLYNISITKLSDEDVAKFRDTRLRLVKPATVVRELAIASHCINTAKTEWGFEDIENVFQNLKKPRVNNSRSRRITEAEWSRIVIADGQLKSGSILRMVELSIETAVRKGELHRIRLEHINLQIGTLLIPYAKTVTQE